MNRIEKKEKRENFEAWVATIDERIFDWFQIISDKKVSLFDYSIDSLDEVEKYLINNYSLEDLKDVKNKIPIDASASYIMKVFSIHWKSHKFTIELEDERNVLFNRPAIITEPELGMAFSPYYFLPSILNLKRVGDLKHVLKTKKRQYIDKYGDAGSHPA